MKLIYIARILLVIGLIVCRAYALPADEIHLKSGKTLEGTVEFHGEDAVIKFSGGGTVKLKSSEIVKVVRTKSRRDVFEEKLSQLDRQDSVSILALVDWCMRNDMEAECEELLMMALEVDPANERAVALLKRLQRARVIPADEKSEKSLQRRLKAKFGKKFDVLRSLHYTFIYDTDSEFARSRAAVFEKVFRSYFGFFEHLDFKLKLPTHKLSVILFDDKMDYAAYIGAPDISAMPDGLYVYDDKSVVFYNAIGKETYEQIRGGVAEVTDNIKRIEAQLRKVRAGSLITIIFNDGKKIVVTKSQAQKMLRRNREQLKERKEEMIGFLKTQNVVTTAHEGTHQLMEASGLFPFMEDSPLWLNEGLATLIEASYKGRWVGVGTINKERLKTFKRALAGEGGMKLHPLEELLSHESLLTSGTKGGILVGYSEVWGLVYYLAKRRRENFVAYLDYIQKSPKLPPMNERRRGRKHLEEFKKYFAEDISAFEAAWIEYIRNLN